MPIDNHRSQRRRWKIGFFALLALVLIFTPHCKNTTEPETVADILAQNLCGAAVDVFLDGVYKFTVDHATDERISGLPFATYMLEAKKMGTEILVFSEPIDLTQSLTYIWVIEGPSVILIGNAYGEDLDIFMNETYAGGVPADESREIPKVGFGNHNLAAFRARDNILVEELSLDIEDVAKYVWLIENK
jgi:hypothetical protein